MSSVRHDENNGAENVTGYAKDTCDMQVSVRGPHPALRTRPPTQPHHICDHVQSTHLFTHQTPTSPPITFLWQNVKAGHCFWHDDLLRLTFQRVSVALINVSRSPARKCNYGYHTPPKTPQPLTPTHSLPLGTTTKENIYSTFINNLSASGNRKETFSCIVSRSNLHNV